MAKTKKTKNQGMENIKAIPIQEHTGALKNINDDWGTIAYLIPRNEIQSKWVDPELRHNSIYFLVGLFEGKQKTYVGQAGKRNNGESVLKRLREHDEEIKESYYDYWTWAVVVTNKDDTWNMTDLDALEYAFKVMIPNCWNGKKPNHRCVDFTAYTDKIEQIKSYIYSVGFGLKMFEDTENTKNIQVTPIEDKNFIVEDLQKGMSLIPEIITPPLVAKEMIDMLPEEVWNDETVFIDPACKTGIYLQEIYERLMNSELVQSKHPNKTERHNYILKNQIYGIALSQVAFERTSNMLLGYDYNIRVIPNYINKLKGIGLGSKPDGTTKTIKDILNEGINEDMKMKVIIGNPPYQELTGSGYNGGRALYNFFIDAALEIADITSFIVPSRWMSDKPNGLEDNWLSTIRQRNDFVNIVDYADSTACFKGDVSIAGGVCHFIINTAYHGDAHIKYVSADNEVSERVGKLANDDGIVIRNQKVKGIAEKVNTDIKKSLYTIIGTNRQFSPNDSYFSTNWTGFSEIEDEYNYIRYYANSRVQCIDGYISEDDLPEGTLSLVKIFKMFLPLTGPTNNQVVSLPFIGGINSCCSRTYAPMYGTPIDNEEKANNCIKYWKTKFLRLLVSAIKTTQHATRKVYILVPLQDFTSNSDIDWSQSIENIDKQLYKKYNLIQEEIDYIESTIKPMV